MNLTKCNWSGKMIAGLIAILFLILMMACSKDPNSIKLRMGYFQTQAEAKAYIESLSDTYNELDKWEKRAKEVKTSVFLGADLGRTFKKYGKHPLAPIRHSKRQFDGYSVENVAIEAAPGFYVTGNLYIPAEIVDKAPVILCPHGHFDDPGNTGRMRRDMQHRCAAFAKMGAYVFAYDMLGYGDSQQLEHHKQPRSLQIQTFSGIRVLDFMMTLDNIDPQKVAVTGASGGGTQTILLTAIDDRISVSAPVVMVSAHFNGGCVCESGMPIHTSNGIETSNIEIAALAAPRPLLLVSDGNDWTKNTPDVEYPFLKRIYALYGAESNIENVHLQNEFHDYGFSKRKAVYTFFGKHLNLDINKITDESGMITENFVTLLNENELHVFNEKHPIPDHALEGAFLVDMLFD